MLCRRSGLCRVGLASAAALIAAGSFVSGAAQEPASPATSQTVVLRGKIIFEGSPPAPRRIQMAADPYCAQFTNMSGDVRVSDRGLENVMVYISSPLIGEFSQPAGVVTLDARECRFEPRVVTLQVGQRLVIRNTDQTAINVHGWPTLNRSFNISLSRAGVQTEQVFSRPEAAFPIRDDVHNWMASFVGVFAHPFHTVSGTGGIYELRVPPGDYQITAWHEKLGTSQQSVQVRAGENPPVNFVFKQP